MLFLFIFISTLTNIRQINWAFLKSHEQKGLIQPRKHQIIIWHTTISKIVHPSLSKNMKGPIQIKREKCYSLMLLCLKINCIKLRTKYTKSLPSSSKTTKSSFPNIQIFLRVILLMSAIYFRVIIMVVFCFANTRGLC